MGAQDDGHPEGGAPVRRHGVAAARVLVRMPNWLGDIVMALPALGAVRASFERAVLAVGVPEPFAPLMRAVSGVNETLPLATTAGWRRVRADARAMAEGRFDVVVLFTNSFGSAVAAWRAGIPERWGYRRDFRRWMLTRPVARRAPGTGESRHQSRDYTRLAESLGMPVPPVPPRVEVSDAWRDRAARLLADHGIAGDRAIVGLAPGAAYGGAKRWPPARVGALVRLMADRAGAACVLVGAAADRDTGHEIESAIRAGAAGRGGPRLVNLIGRTDLPALAGVMACCRAFVSNDSGAMHLAAAIGVPVTAVFGPTREWATAPLGPHTIVTHDVFCRPCMLRECPIDHRCMTRITPETVFDSVARHLAGDGR
jgi:heptosyltransferase-2